MIAITRTTTSRSTSSSRIVFDTVVTSSSSSSRRRLVSVGHEHYHVNNSHALPNSILKNRTNFRKNSSPSNRRRHTFTTKNSNSSKVNSSSSSSSSISNGRNDATTLKKKDTTTTTTATSTLQSFAIGSFAGVIGSLTGMGGGFVMVPLLTSSYLLKLNQHAAHGTSLFAVAATGIAGAVAYSGIMDNDNKNNNKKSYVKYEEAIALAISATITANLGAKASIKLSEYALKKILGMFMLAVAPLVPYKGYMHDQERKKKLQQQIQEEQQQQSNSIRTVTTSHVHTDPQATKKENYNDDDDYFQSIVVPQLQKLVPPSFIGLGSGFLAGLFGVGGGVVVVPALTLFTDMNHYEALGTSLCAMIFPAVSGTLTHYKNGNVMVRVAPPLALGAFVGAFLGGQVSIHTNEMLLQYGFSSLMVTLGIRTLLK